VLGFERGEALQPGVRMQLLALQLLVLVQKRAALGERNRRPLPGAEWGVDDELDGIDGERQAVATPGGVTILMIQHHEGAADEREQQESYSEGKSSPAAIVLRFTWSAHTVRRVARPCPPAAGSLYGESGRSVLIQ